MTSCLYRLASSLPSYSQCCWEVAGILSSQDCFASSFCRPLPVQFQGHNLLDLKFHTSQWPTAENQGRKHKVLGVEVAWLGAGMSPCLHKILTDCLSPILKRSHHILCMGMSEARACRSVGFAVAICAPPHLFNSFFYINKPYLSLYCTMNPQGVLIVH